MLAGDNLWSSYTIPEFKLYVTMTNPYMKTFNSNQDGNKYIYDITLKLCNVVAKLPLLLASSRSFILSR